MICLENYAPSENIEYEKISRTHKVWYAIILSIYEDVYWAWYEIIPSIYDYMYGVRYGIKPSVFNYIKLYRCTINMIEGK